VVPRGRPGRNTSAERPLVGPVRGRTNPNQRRRRPRGKVACCVGSNVMAPQPPLCTAAPSHWAGLSGEPSGRLAFRGSNRRNAPFGYGLPPTGRRSHPERPRPARPRPAAAGASVWVGRCVRLRGDLVGISTATHLRCRCCHRCTDIAFRANHRERREVEGGNAPWASFGPSWPSSASLSSSLGFSDGPAMRTTSQPNPSGSGCHGDRRS
jgi:hypothetical protein